VSRRLDDEQRAVAWQVSSLLLGYPDDDLLARLPVVRDAVALVPGPVGEHLGRFVGRLGALSPSELAAGYVDTFDHTRRCCLYLTYYAYGDTRKRGMALLKFKNAYRIAGLHLGDAELPDHLAVVLEFGATADHVTATRLLTEHRAGLELLRLALLDRDSPYADVLEAVSLTLPPIGARDAEAVARLAAEGPPAEEVGLQPFGPPEHMPSANSQSPTSHLMGARR
jgi:nitrate reductase molybdenum cofactor assembly chaperone NarJ/NarW